MSRSSGSSTGSSSRSRSPSSSSASPGPPGTPPPKTTANGTAKVDKPDGLTQGQTHIPQISSADSTETTTPQEIDINKAEDTLNTQYSPTHPTLPALPAQPFQISQLALPALPAQPEPHTQPIQPPTQSPTLQASTLPLSPSHLEVDMDTDVKVEPTDPTDHSSSQHSESGLPKGGSPMAHFQQFHTPALLPTPSVPPLFAPMLPLPHPPIPYPPPLVNATTSTFMNYSQPATVFVSPTTPSTPLSSSTEIEPRSTNVETATPFSPQPSPALLPTPTAIPFPTPTLSTSSSTIPSTKETERSFDKEKEKEREGRDREREKDYRDYRDRDKEYRDYRDREREREREYARRGDRRYSESRRELPYHSSTYTKPDREPTTEGDEGPLKEESTKTDNALTNIPPPAATTSSKDLDQVLSNLFKTRDAMLKGIDGVFGELQRKNQLFSQLISREEGRNKEMDGLRAELLNVKKDLVTKHEMGVRRLESEMERRLALLERKMVKLPQYVFSFHSPLALYNNNELALTNKIRIRIRTTRNN